MVHLFLSGTGKRDRRLGRYLGEMGKLQAAGWCLLVVAFYHALGGAAQQGFISIDCGAKEAYTDQATGISWIPDVGYTNGGSVANISQTTTTIKQLQTLRYFAGTQSKYCYNLGPVNASGRYLVRATFLYGDYDGAEVFPIFNISMGASTWATVTILTASDRYFEEFVAVATNATSFSVCLVRGPTGSPFISTLEVRPLQNAMYSLDILGANFLASAARINFGAESDDPVRYPDDPVDRIWVSDNVWPLQGEAPGTQSQSTSRAVDVTKVEDGPPEKVMQSAVVGTEGYLSYRLDLAAFPAACYAVLYFAEIEEVQPGDTRSFKFEININDTQFKDQPLNPSRDAGEFTAFEPGYTNVVFPRLLDFSLVKADNATLDPLVNALEIYRILPVAKTTHPTDVAALNTLTAQLPLEEIAGDPCLPVPWGFLTCNSDSPPRVTTIDLSGRNLRGGVPEALGTMSGVVDLWLDNNHLDGTVPDLSNLIKLKTLHLQNNALDGSFPSSLERLKNLSEIFVADNNLTGSVPRSLLERTGLLLDASGNPYLCANLTCDTNNSKSGGVNVAALVGGAIGGVILILSVAIIVVMCVCKRDSSASIKKARRDSMEGSHFPFHSSSAEGTVDLEDYNMQSLSEAARLFHLSELVAATDKFSTMIGSGGYGPVYYGKAKDNQEIAVKVLATNSNQGAREFFNEVSLLSRIHHRNLVNLIGYCPDIKERMLIYEYMHKGSLRDHLHGTMSEEEPVDWLARLQIVLDAAKGIEYLHTGCNPPIIHRDVKSSNILINNRLVGKVADFGLSKLTTEDVSAVSTTVRGTVGYLDPEYYVSQQLTTKSDVFSFGVVLLEIITGREPIIVGQRSTPDSNLVNWARNMLLKGDVHGMVDPALGCNYRTESLWKLSELAIRSVEPHSRFRPTMGEIVAELTEIIYIELPESVAGESSNASGEGSEEEESSFRTFSFMRPPTNNAHGSSESFAFDTSSIGPLHSGSLTDSYNEPILR